MSTNKKGGAEVEVVSVQKKMFGKKQASRPKKLIHPPSNTSNNNSKRFWIIGLIILLIGIYWFFVRDTSPPPAAPGRDLTKITQAKNTQEVVDKYSRDYGETSALIQQAPVASWDKATLDKAYFNLVYADKVGAFNQVYNALYFLEAARQNGVNIDDNSYGINQQQRDEIKKRADAAAQALKNASDNPITQEVTQ